MAFYIPYLRYVTTTAYDFLIFFSILFYSSPKIRSLNLNNFDNQHFVVCFYLPTLL